MYCKNCGNALPNGVAFCSHCGVRTEGGDKFCPACGKPVYPGYQCCAFCGHPLQNTSASGLKSRATAGILGIFLGCFGAHNFYLGYTGKAVAQLLITLLTCGIGSVVTYVWGLVEAIWIMRGKNITKDGQGRDLAE